MVSWSRKVNNFANSLYYYYYYYYYYTWKGVEPSPTPQCSSYWKGAFGPPSITVANFIYLLFLLVLLFYLLLVLLFYLLRVFHISVSWSLSNSKCPQVPRIPLGILSDLNNAVVWTVSDRPVISKSSSPCTTPLVTVSRSPITIGIIIIFMFRRIS